RAVLPVDDPGVLLGLPAGDARPTLVLAVGRVVRLCAPLQVDDREPSGRTVDPGRVSSPTPRRVHRVVERLRAPGLRREDPVRVAGRGSIYHHTQSATPPRAHGF